MSRHAGDSGWGTKRSLFARLVGLVVLALSVALSVALSQPATAAVAPQALPDIVEPLLKSVVNISVLKKAGSDPTDRPDQVVPDRAQGSGFVISPDGFIVTNKHVVDGGYDVSVSFSDGSTFPAEVLATNRRPDLALLKINAGKPLPSVHFGDSDALRIGETVLAIGNPLGLSSSLSVGVVSALNRDVNMTMIDDFIQTDAAINHGNSGGPLFNLKGEVIGVNWALLAPGQQTGSAGLGLAIPSNDASWVVDEMRRYGRMHAGFAGLRLQQVTPDIQLELGLPSRTGGIVTGVVPNAPAAAIGLQEGDVVLALNGHEPHDVRALLRSLSTNPPGTKVTLTVWRKGTTKTYDLQVGEWPKNTLDPAGPPPTRNAARRLASADLGLKLAPADKSLLQRSPFYLGTPAVVISAVSANSPAADLRLSAGDVIIRVARDAVASPADVKAGFDKARAAGRRDVLMLVDAGGDRHWVVIPLTRP